jgi:hypothetical protein
MENLMCVHIENLRNRLQTHSEEHGGNNKIQNLMWTHLEPDGNMTRNTHWELEEQVKNPFRRTLWEPQNSELDVNKLRTWWEHDEQHTLRTWWEHDEQHTLRTWGTVYKPIQKNMMGTTKFGTWCEQIENLMGTWWATHIANLRNRLQTHSEEHGGNDKIRNLMWTNWEPHGNMMSNTHCELEEQVTNPFRSTLWEPQNSELDVNKLRTWSWCELDKEQTLGTWGTGHKPIKKNMMESHKFESLMWTHWELDHRNLVTTIYSKLGMTSKSKNIQN